MKFESMICCSTVVLLLGIGSEAFAACCTNYTQGSTPVACGNTGQGGTESKCIAAGGTWNPTCCTGDSAIVTGCIDFCQNNPGAQLFKDDDSEFVADDLPLEPQGLSFSAWLAEMAGRN